MNDMLLRTEDELGHKLFRVAGNAMEPASRARDTIRRRPLAYMSRSQKWNGSLILVICTKGHGKAKNGKNVTFDNHLVVHLLNVDVGGTCI